jgi:hypothetical protein
MEFSSLKCNICNTHKVFYHISSQDLKGRDHLDDLLVDKKLITKGILEKQGMTCGLDSPSSVEGSCE